MIRRAEKIQGRFGEDIRLGRFAGFDLFIRSSYNNSTELVLRGQNSYGIRITDTGLGTIRSLESMVQGFEERAVQLEADIKIRKSAVELEAKVGAPFEKEQRYHHLAKRQSEIEDKLDLTKNQAPAQAEEILPDTEEETIAAQTTAKPKQERKKKTGIRV